MLHVHRAERADQLVAALGGLLAEPLADPLATEVIAVPSRGIERWIAQELSARLGAGELGTDGVCANVDFPFPARLVRAAVAAGSGVDPDADPWLPERLTWPLLDIVATDPTAEMLGPLRTHVGGANPADDPTDDGLARRLGAVRHVADLFDRYGVHRPAMVCRWADGDDVGPDGGAISARHAWQPQLWRAVRDRIDTESFAERRASAIAALHDDPGLLDLPPRLALFGLTALPATFLEVVAAIGAHRDLQLLLLHPSRDLWERVSAHATTQGPTTDAAQVLPLREDDATAALVRNPLLASWGRDVRELQLIAPLPDAADLTHHDLDDPAADRPPTLLERLQADVRADRHPGAPTGPDRPRLAPDDTSVQLHDCHGRLRQVEVLRDAILHLLADRDGLEPRDVIVMCPDIEAFAPLVTAVFGAAAVVDEHTDPADVPGDAPPALRVRLADRSLRGTNPVLEVTSQLLDLVDGRATASDVVDLVAREPIRRRFGLTEDDVDTIETWVGDLQVKWGFDADHRVDQGLPALDAHTWHAGCQRLLLGAAMADEDLRLVEGVAPYDGLEGTATALAGRFVELLARLEDGLADLSAPRPVAAWRDAIGAVADRLTDTARTDVWQRLQLHRVLDELVEEATVAGAPSDVELTLAEVRTTLADRLAGGPSSTSHRTGDLTFSTLVPMRSVPHRVVCLLGLDDGAFPRQVVRDDDDLLGLAPRVGDRDPRSEDRQLLLDALMAATETLVVTYAGRHERTNEDRPPAVPVDELRDAIDRTVAVDDDRRPRDHVTIRHPLAEHDPRNFTTEVTTDAATRSTARPRGAWGFDPAVLQAARAGLGTPEPPARFLVDPLPPLDTDVVELTDLVDFLVHPVKAFIRQRLGFTVPDDDEPESDSIPSTLRGLEGWAVGDQLLQAWLDDDADPARVLEVLRAKGAIPPGDLAADDLDTIEHRVDRIVALCERCGVTPGGRRSVDVEVELPDGRTLVGDVPDVDTAQHQLLNISYSSVAPKHRLRTWARWLALLARYPGDWTAITAGRHSFWRRKEDAQAFLLTEPSRGQGAAAFATRNLQVLLDLYDRGMREPLPLYCATSAKIADNVRRDRAPDSYLSDEWTSSPHSPVPKEDVDPHHQLVLGGAVAPADLFTEPCRDDERDWGLETPRVVTYAQRLWEPVLDTERRCEQK